MRASALLLHITSLPGPWGLGSMGKAAYEFVDFLQSAGQRFWQILPLGPTGFGDSPYQTLSAFAGNPYLIDLDLLVADGLLWPEELECVFWGADPERADFGALYEGRWPLLEKACERGWGRDRAAVERFAAENRDWLPDYALFMAAKRHFNMKPWTQWPDEALRLHRGEALEVWRERLAADVRLFTYVQFLFFKQWNALRAYARERGVGILGDIPIYVPLDSAEVWAERHYFQLDEEGQPRAVAGVPPDYFSADGQLWGNPLYDWERMRRDDFWWWRRRMAAAGKLYDMLRLDHFRGLESYWAVPYGDETARNGRWERGPGAEFIRCIKEHFPHLPILAEDLGFLTEAVFRLRDEAGWPGMKVLQFAFDPGAGSVYLPHRIGENCVCYTGTHDNDTLAGWLETAPAEELAFLREYLGLGPEDDPAEPLLRAGMASKAMLFVSPLQDWLGLGSEARMNCPGEAAGNWQWRLKEGALTEKLAASMRRMTHIYGR